MAVQLRKRPSPSPEPRIPARHPPAHRLIFIARVILLVSAQVQTKSGVRVLEAVSFGVFARVQRAASSSCTACATCGELRRPARGAATRTKRCKRSSPSSRSGCSSSGRWRREHEQLQELLDLKQSTPLPTVAAEVIAGNANPGMRRSRSIAARPTASGEHGGHRARGRRRPGDRAAGGARGARAALIIDRNAAAGALIERTRAGGMVVGVEAIRRSRWSWSRTWRTSSRRLVVDVGGRRHLSEGLLDRPRRDGGRAAGLYQDDHGPAGVDFSSLEEVLVVLVPPRSATPTTAERRRNEGSSAVLARWSWRWRCRRRWRACRSAGDRSSTSCSWRWSTSRCVRAGGRPARGDARRAGAGRAGGRDRRHRRAVEDAGRVLVGVLGAQFIVSRRCRGS